MRTSPFAIGTRPPDDYFIALGLPRIMRVAGVGQMRARGSGVGHDHHADTEVIVRVHRESHAEHFAQRRQLLLFANAAPVMRIGQHDLNRIAPPSLRNVGKAGDCDVARERGIDALGQQPAPDLGHAVHAGGGIFQITAAPEFVLEFAADADGSVDGPRASSDRYGAGSSGPNSAYSAWMVAISRSGSRTPPLSLISRKP